jgi:hypothetical protein
MKRISVLHTNGDLQQKYAEACSEMYGESIALSFCEGCHVSHDRRLVWEVGQKSSSFRPKRSYSMQKTLGHRLSATGSLRHHAKESDRGWFAARSAISRLAGELIELEEP